jgi:hypothetical protein
MAVDDHEVAFEAYWQDQVVPSTSITRSPRVRLPAQDYFKHTDINDESGLVMGLVARLTYPDGVYTIEYLGYGAKLLKSGRPGKGVAKAIEVPARKIPRRYRDMLVAAAQPDVSKIRR